MNAPSPLPSALAPRPLARPGTPALAAAVDEAPGFGAPRANPGDLAMPASTELQAWWERARAGDERARDALCRGLRPLLYRVAFSWLRDADEADDVAQEALVRVLSRSFWWRGPDRIEAWTAKVALNLARNRVRDTRRRAQLIAREGAPTLQARGALAPEPADALDGILVRERWASAEEALARLPGRQQEVLRLRLLGRLAFADIAQALGIREENARVTCAQARARMEKIMTQADASPAQGGKP